MTKYDALQKQFRDAVHRLDEILQKRKSDIIRDSAIKRFELTFDISWKLVKTFLEEKKGIACTSPKECFRVAYREGLIDYDEFWMDMTDLRNEAVHTYSQAFAQALYRKLPQTLKRFRRLDERIRKKS